MILAPAVREGEVSNSFGGRFSTRLTVGPDLFLMRSKIPPIGERSFDMSSPLNFRTLSVAGLVLSLLTAAAAQAQEEQKEMADNPHYQYWHAHKPGSTVVRRETTKLTAPDSQQPASNAPDEKRIAYKLLESDDKRVVVEMVVTEKEPLGYVQDAPTRYIYPAKVPKQELEQHMQMTGATAGEDVVKLKDKELKAKTQAGTIKEPDGTEVEYKVWLSDEVPGGVVKKTQTTRQNGNVIAETTVTTVSYKDAE
jgi:hypothetical protein